MSVSYNCPAAIPHQIRETTPSDNSIRRWYAQFQETGCVCKRKSTGRLSVTEEQVEQVGQAFVRSPRKSTVRGSRELGILQQKMWHILRKRLKLKPYRLMLLEKLQPDDQHRRTTFCTELQALMEEDDFFERLIFSDECTFHLCGKVNRNNVRVWGTENPKSVVEVACDSRKVNVFFCCVYF